MANRATIGNMSPEYGSTAAIFPIDAETVRYLRMTGRTDDQLALVEAYAKEQGLWHDPAANPTYPKAWNLTSAPWCRRSRVQSDPRIEIPLSESKEAFRAALADYAEPTALTAVDEADRESFPASDPPAIDATAANGHAHVAVATATGRPTKPTELTLADGTSMTIDHGAVVIAAITSCTNTSNPYR